MEKVGIVVVTYNRILTLKEVVKALRLQTYINKQIIVINNGSTDNTLNWLKEQKDIITITQENSGGAGGFYTGMKYVAENNYKYCWVMDDDVICTPTALEELYNAFNLKQNIGFVCSKVIGTNGCPMNTPNIDLRPSVNGYPDWLSMIEYNMIKVQMATFVSVFLSTERIFEIGLPIKEFFIWGDDTEYTMRISNKYECYVVGKSIVIHKRILQEALSFDRETDRNRLRNYFYSYRNGGYLNTKASTKRKFIHYIKQFILSFKHLIKGEFYKSYIIIKALISLYSFNPEINFPKK